MLDTHLDLLDTDITSKFLVVSETSSRRLEEMSSGHLEDMSSRRLQDMPSGSLQAMSLRRLEDVFSVTTFRLPRRLARYLQNVYKTSWKTKHCYTGDVLKTSSRNVSKTSSRRVEDQQMLAGKL